jgi:hypothetical protein
VVCVGALNEVAHFRVEHGALVTIAQARKLSNHFPDNGELLNG